jgi:hypothetical protein
MNAGRSHAALWLGVAFVVIVLFALAPLISAMIAGGIANALGCTLNEGGASGCIYNGNDIGETLADMFVAGWLMFVTLPIGGVALAIWLVVAIVVLARKRLRAGQRV